MLDSDKNPIHLKMEYYLRLDKSFAEHEHDRNIIQIDIPDNIKPKLRFNMEQQGVHDQQEITRKLKEIKMYARWATKGDIVVFNGSALHGVSNDVNFTTNEPQIVLAMNIGIGSQILD